ncbi:DUF190 domain-containing protein [Hydrogenobaculum acidophilum]
MKKLSIYYKEKDRIDGKSFCKVIFELLEKINISGATAFKSIYSYGASGNVSNVYIEVESYNMGMRMDVIDEDEKIYKLVDMLKAQKLLLVISDCEVIYGDGKSD